MPTALAMAPAPFLTPCLLLSTLPLPMSLPQMLEGEIWFEAYPLGYVSYLCGPPYGVSDTS